MAFLSEYARQLRQQPLPWLLLMPILCAFFIGFGVGEAEVESRIYRIWVPTSSAFALDQDYKESVSTDAGSPLFLGISAPRKEANAMQSDLLLEMKDRLEYTQAATVTVDGMEFTWDDVCVNPSGYPYMFPCYRMTVLDCYQEGEYDFHPVAQATWEAQAVATGVASYEPTIVANGVETTAYVATVCLAAGCDASASGATCDTYADGAYCYAGVNTVMDGMDTATRTQTYYATLYGMFALQGYTIDSSCATTPTSELCTATLDGYFDAYVGSLGGITGKNPYTYEGRTSLANANDAEILTAGSGTCNTWNDALPPVNPVLAYAAAPKGHSPADFSSTNPLEYVRAFQHIYRMLRPEDIIERVASTNPYAVGYRAGGTLDITRKQADEVLYKMKEAMEKRFRKDWDGGSGQVSNTAFTDDTAIIGSFGRMLVKVTLESVPLSIACYAITVVLAIGFLFSCDAVASQVALACCGTCLAILAFVTSLFITAIAGIHLNIVHMWTLPFLLVGIGIDDMFIIVSAARAARREAKDLEQLLREVCAPVSMTSIVNGAMFAMMLLSDLNAIKHTALTALIAIALLWGCMMTCFLAMLVLDGKRQDARRYDVACCVAPAAAAAAAKNDLNIFEKAYENAYKPFITAPAGHAAVAVVALAVFITAAVSMASIPVGLDLDDFFPIGTPEGEFTKQRLKFFPVWPLTMNWGQLDYTDPNVQMGMVQQWENVVATKNVADGVASNLVWTAKFAEWGIPASYALGPCDSSNTLTSGNCGPTLDATCTATWVENTKGLLVGGFGYCRDGADIGLEATKSWCPVFDGLTEEEFAECVRLWYTTNEPAVATPGLEFEADGVLKTPIRYSKADGNALYGVGLFETDDYMDMITDTRKHCDDKDKDVDDHLCWMSGIAYEYYEQYLTIDQWLLTVTGSAIAIGFAVAFAFLFLSSSGAPGAKFAASVFGAFAISLVSVLGVITVCGLCAALEIKLCGFSAMSITLSIGFAVEYSVHVTFHFLSAPATAPKERIEHAMGKLFAPTLMAFLSSAIGIIMLGFTKFMFIKLYFFIPLLLTLFVTYFYGTFLLPVVLQYAPVACFAGGFAGAAAVSAEPEKSDEPVPAIDTQAVANPVELAETEPVPINEESKDPGADSTCGCVL